MSIDDLVSKALWNGLNRAESTFAGAHCNKRESLVHTTQRRYIHSLTSDHTTWANTSGIFTCSWVADCINQNLNGVVSSEKVDDFKCLLHNEHGFLLLSTVSSFLHDCVHQSLHNGTSCLMEALHLPFSSRVGEEDFRFSSRDRNISLQRFILNLEVFVGPLSKQLLCSGELLLVSGLEVLLLVLYPSARTYLLPFLLNNNNNHSPGQSSSKFYS